MSALLQEKNEIFITIHKLSVKRFFFLLLLSVHHVNTKFVNW